MRTFQLTTFSLCREVSVMNLVLQWEKPQGFFPVCILIWILSVHGLLKVLKHRTTVGFLTSVVSHMIP